MSPLTRWRIPSLSQQISFVHIYNSDLQTAIYVDAIVFMISKIDVQWAEYDTRTTYSTWVS